MDNYTYCHDVYTLADVMTVAARNDVMITFYFNAGLRAHTIRMTDILGEYVLEKTLPESFFNTGNATYVLYDMIRQFNKAMEARKKNHGKS